jgi:hypothetical protein
MERERKGGGKGGILNKTVGSKRKIKVPAKQINKRFINLKLTYIA